MPHPLSRGPPGESTILLAHATRAEKNRRHAIPTIRNVEGESQMDAHSYSNGPTSQSAVIPTEPDAPETVPTVLSTLKATLWNWGTAVGFVLGGATVYVVTQLAARYLTASQDDEQPF